MSDPVTAAWRTLPWQRMGPSSTVANDGDGDGGDAYLAMASLDPYRSTTLPATSRRSGLLECCAFVARWIMGVLMACSTTCGQWLPCCGRGVRLNGRRLRVMRILGEGAYAQVYQVQDTRGHRFALKRMILQELEQRTVALKEIGVHEKLGNSCPFLMPLLDHEVVVASGGTREEALLLFPLFATSMQAILEARAPTGQIFSETDALARFANIMMTESGAAVLGDFGSAAPGRVAVTSRFQALNLQEDAAQYCSMPYRAPELFDIPSDSVLTPKSDVWSLGCTLFAMMYGYSPFECEFREDGIARVVECSHLRVLNPPSFPSPSRTSPEFVQLVRWLLQADPTKRPSLDDVMDRIEGMGVACPGRLPRSSESSV